MHNSLARQIARRLAARSLEPLPAVDIATIEPSPRATLMAPLPYGLGTPQVEHLASYLHRVARLHQVRLRHLARELVRPLVWSLRAEYRRGRFAAAFRRRSVPFGTLFGAGPEAAIWVWASEQLTGRTDLRYLTLLPYGELGSTWLRTSWLRTSRAWCPACYLDARRLELVGYDQLRWTCVTVLQCDIHGGPLWFACPHCGSRQPWHSLEEGDGDLEYCMSCRRWLGGGAGVTPAPPIPKGVRHAALARPPAEAALVLEDALACAYRLRPGSPYQAPITSFAAFVEDIDEAGVFYRHLLAQLRRRWALEHTALWDALGVRSGLRDAEVVERIIFDRPTFVVSPVIAWPAPEAIRRAAALRHLEGQRRREIERARPETPARKHRLTRKPRRLPRRPPRSEFEAAIRVAADNLRELEELGERSYPGGPRYQEWLPSRPAPLAGPESSP